MKLWPFGRKNLEHAVEQAALPLIEKFGETLTPNMRALRMATTMADQLLSMGVSANSVVSKVLDVTDTYCKKPVHLDISANVIMVSQLRGIEREPLTLIRPVAPRNINYMTIQSIQNLIFEIGKGHHTLDEAEEQLETIITNPKKFPWWVIMIGNASIVAGVTLMYTSTWQVILTTFCIGIMIDRLLALLIKYAIPPFFRQVIAAASIALIAAGINALARQGIEFFADMNPTLLVVGGVVMLVAGLVIVGAVQDAIDEYYVTANARLTKVFMQTIGIVAGILIALYTARKLGIGISVSVDPLSLNSFDFQVAGAIIASAGYALAGQTRRRAVIGVGIIGGAGLFIMSYTVTHLGISIVPASGVAALFIGVSAAIISRFWRTPSVGIISGAIVPLVPGLTLYTGLMQIIQYPPGVPLFFNAVGTLFTALALALTIAAGASLGSMVGRPLRQQLASTRNIQPFAVFMRRQVGPSPGKSLASLALGKFRRPRLRQPAQSHDPESIDKV
ncbi:threonine/serine exporter family protein [Candidatus Saccharibacteria bacterium]|nr:threonine/serine exporter family protein [Candidatus Saccharibacteria bacterium]